MMATSSGVRRGKALGAGNRAPAPRMTTAIGGLSVTVGDYWATWMQTLLPLQTRAWPVQHPQPPLA